MAAISLSPTEVTFFYTYSGTSTNWTTNRIGCLSSLTTYNALVKFDMTSYNAAYITNMVLVLTCSEITGTTFSFSIRLVSGNLVLSSSSSSSSTTTNKSIGNSLSQLCTVMYNEGMKILGTNLSTAHYADNCVFSLQFDYNDPGTLNHVVLTFSNIVQYLDGVESSNNTKYVYYYRGSSGAATYKQTMNYFPLNGFSTTKMSNLKFIAIPDTNTSGTGGTATYKEYVYLTQPDASLSTNITFPTSTGSLILFSLTPGNVDLSVGFYLYLYSSNFSRLIDLEDVRTYLEFDYDGAVPGNTNFWVYTSGSWQLANSFVYNGTAWEPGFPYINDGTEWH